MGAYIIADCTGHLLDHCTGASSRLNRFDVNYSFNGLLFVGVHHWEMW